MELGLDGRTALVIGASSGIGRAIAESLSREGATVVMASRSGERISAAAEEVARATGSPTVAMTADTNNIEDLPRLVASAAESGGGHLDILVTNTGGPAAGGSLESDTDDWQSAYRNLVLAPRALVLAALPAMREQRWGRIINVGSTSVHEPIANLALSNVHRAALLGFFKSLASEVAAEGVTVNDIATGRFATDRLAAVWGGWQEMLDGAPAAVPAGRLGDPAEFGDLAAFLASDRAAYITGTSIPIDGGMMRST